MSISEERLDNLSKLASSTKYSEKYDEVKKAISSYKSFPEVVRWEVYLQGSYANSTNVKSDSDVDVVIELTSAFSYNVNHLDSVEKQNFERDFPSSAQFGIREFKEHVVQALSDYFGKSRVEVGNKSIKILPSDSSDLYADVVVCTLYRLYFSYSRSYSRYEEGIVFWSQKENEMIVNFPKQHISNGESKNQTCSEYKATVRMIKNLKNLMIEKGLIEEKLAPSYFVECLISNLPDSLISTNRSNTFYQLINWYIKLDENRKNELLCGNHIHYLFRETNQQWRSIKADEFIIKLFNYHKEN